MMKGFLSLVVNRPASFHNVASVQDVLCDLLISSFHTYPTFRHVNLVGMMLM